MHRRLFASFSAALIASGLVASACAEDATTAPAAGPDASSDAPDVNAPDTYRPPPPPPDDAAVKSCALDNGNDPVFLCTQKVLLQGLRDAVLSTQGVASSWSVTSGLVDADDAGAPLHDVHDDVAYASACVSYGVSATRYGDTELTSLLDGDLLTKLAPVLKSALATPPDEYDGELYVHLRNAAGGLRLLSSTADADALDALADAIGRGIFAHFVTLSGADAGSEAGADAGDAGASGDGVLAKDATGKEYAPDKAASGAVALLDMAVRHATDDAAHVPSWISAARQSLDHVYARGRDTSGLYFRALAAGTGSTHDDLAPSAPAPADVLATEVTAGVALELLRAADLVATSSANRDGGAPIGPLSGLTSYPFVTRATAAIAALNGTPSLYDTDKGGYFEGYVPSSATLLTNKPTRANARALMALHRANVLAVIPQSGQVKTLRTLVTARTPQGSGLFSAVPGQYAFLDSVARDFTVPAATIPLGDAGDASVAPFRPNSYTSAATLLVVEGLDEGWVGYP